MRRARAGNDQHQRAVRNTQSSAIHPICDDDLVSILKRRVCFCRRQHDLTPVLTDSGKRDRRRRCDSSPRQQVLQRNTGIAFSLAVGIVHCFDLNLRHGSKQPSVDRNRMSSAAVNEQEIRGRLADLSRI